VTTALMHLLNILTHSLTHSVTHSHCVIACLRTKCKARWHHCDVTTVTTVISVITPIKPQSASSE